MSVEQTENRKTDRATAGVVDAVRVVTLGCRLNSFESEIIRDHARSGNSTGNKNRGRETVVINTCAVTAEAERQGRQIIRRLRRESPRARIVVTGCAAQLSPGTYTAMPEVDRVLGNTEKLDPTRFLARDMETGAPVAVSHLNPVSEKAPPLFFGFFGRNRALLLGPPGCERGCPSCLISPLAGASRSTPPGGIR